MWGCGEEKTLEPILTDSVAPGKAILEEVENFAGGAKITYTLPNDIDLMYVKAEYEVNNKQMQVKASFYQNYLEVYGFNEEKDYKVNITCLDRSGNESSPLTVTVTPLKAPVFQIAETLTLSPDWSGVRYNWTNEHLAPVVVNLIAKNNENKLEAIEWVYTQFEKGTTAIRGFDTIENVFAAVVRDRYDNYSDTIFANIKPLFEEQIILSQNNLLGLSDDNKELSWSKGWKGVFEEGNKKYVCMDKPLPFKASMDLNVRTKLSRFIIKPRVEKDSHYYGLGNPQKFRLYGTNELPSEEGLEEWTLLGTYDITRPSGLPLSDDLNSEDKEYFKNGYECLVPIEAPKVRYIRLVVDKTFGNATYTYFSEFKLFGSTK